jgi:cytochrome c oxidase subunit 2
MLQTLLVFGLLMSMPQRAHAADEVRTIDIHAHRFAFVPSEVTLKPGETVKLRLYSDDVTHSLRVPGLRINQEISKGRPVEVTVTPNSVGDFPGQCGRFCGSGHGSMLFVIRVKE